MKVDLHYPYMKRRGLVFMVTLLGFGPILAQAATVAERTSGRILLDVENHGEAWYVYPGNQYRFYLGRPNDAFDIMRFLGLGITDADLGDIPTEVDNFEGNLALRQRLSGYILLQVQQHGEAWYVNPTDLHRYYLGRPDDAFNLITEFGLGISNSDLIQIPISSDFLSIGTFESKYESFALTTERGTFNIDVISLGRDNFTMLTDTAELSDCGDNCAAKSLLAHVDENGGNIGIHGTYFCPPDYSACTNKINTFNPPVYNTATGTMINEGKLRFHSGPLMAVDTNGTYYYFHRAPDFGYTVDEFEQTYGVQLQAAIANYPSLVEGGKVIVGTEPLEFSQTLSSTRGGIGYNDDQVFLVIAHSASVTDLAYIMQTLSATYAMNLDGGGSSALYMDGYKDGPGRTLPNAIVFKYR